MNYLNFNPNYKDSEYLDTIESLLKLLGFNLIFGILYKNTTSGKQERLNNVFSLNYFLKFKKW